MERFRLKRISWCDILDMMKAVFRKTVDGTNVLYYSDDICYIKGEGHG